MLAPALVLLLAAQPAAPAPQRAVMIVPVEGTDVMPAMRAQLDAHVRTSASVLADARVLSRAETDAAMEDAVTAGLQCSLQAVACLVQLGLVAGVTDILIARARAQPTLELSVLRVDVERASATAIAADRVDLANADSTRPVLLRAWRPPATLSVEVDNIVGFATVDGVTFGAVPDLQPLAVQTGSHAVAVVDARGVVIDQRTVVVSAGHHRVRFGEADEEEPKQVAAGPATGAIAGGVIAGVSGVVAATGLLMAMDAEAQLSKPKPGVDPNVEALQAGGLLGLFGAVVGGIGIAVGVYMLVGAGAES